MYGELRLLEHEMTDTSDTVRNTHEMIARLDRLEDKQIISECRSPMRARYTGCESISTSCAKA